MWPEMQLAINIPKYFWNFCKIWQKHVVKILQDLLKLCNERVALYVDLEDISQHLRKLCKYIFRVEPMDL